jgi:adenylate cyclase
MDIQKKRYTIELVGDGPVQIAEDQTVLQASLAAGIPHYHACGGNASCSTCRILVEAGKEQLAEPTNIEIELRKTIPFPPDMRLACQTSVTGEGVRVHRMIRDETDILFYIKQDSIDELNHTGSQMELALFFLDIRDFTPFVESYLAFDVIHIMRRLFALFRNAVESNNGRIIETAGDGFYAVFGFDTKTETSVENACNAGYQIFKDLDDFNCSYMEKHFRHRFAVGIGLHSGKVVVGNIGIGVNDNLTVTGLAVNIAARLQAATKELNNNFLISQEAFDKLYERPDVREQEIEIKGVKRKVRVHLIGQAYSK